MDITVDNVTEVILHENDVDGSGPPAVPGILTIEESTALAEERAAKVRAELAELELETAKKKLLS